MVEIDGEEYLTTAEAAAAMDVTPAAVRTWVRRGYLEPHPASPPGRRFYTRSAVVAAEKAAHDAAVRTSGSSKRSSRRLLPPPPDAPAAGLPAPHKHAPAA